jgi:hypothetical protein
MFMLAKQTILCYVRRMNFKRLTNPEINDSNLDAPVRERTWRKIGGYALGMGGLLTLVGSRAVLRPAYQNDEDYEDVRAESMSDKTKRVAAFLGGIALFDIGAVMLTGGLFAAAVPFAGRLLAAGAGAFGLNYGRKIVRGSYDPDLFTDESYEAPTTMSSMLKDRFREGYASGRTNKSSRAEERAIQKAQLNQSIDEQKALSNYYLGERMTALRSQYLPAEGSPDRDGFRTALKKLMEEYKEASLALSAAPSAVPQIV